MRRHLLSLPVLALSMPAIAADSLATLLECRDTERLAAPLEQLADLGRGSGYDCRIAETSTGSSLTCANHGAGTAFGQRVRDFVVAIDSEGRLLSVAFAGTPARIAPLVERARTGAPTLLASAELGQREDGVAELRCRRTDGRQGPGAITGLLDYRGVQPVPAMRVCAAPVHDTRHPTCVQTARGNGSYQIDGLAAGDYYVTAYPLDDNPGRLILALTQPQPGCRPNEHACPEHLRRVRVQPGQTYAGADPRSLMQALPPPLSRSTGH
jgi:hypothetical protein